MIELTQCSAILDKDSLLEIIKFQTDITKIGPDMGSILTLITEKSMELTHSEGAVIELAEHEFMVYRAVAGSLDPFLGLKLLIDGSLSGKCLQSGKIMYSKDTTTDERVDQATCVKINARSMVIMPLIHNETSVGVLKIVSSKIDAFDHHDFCTLKIISEIVASLIHNSAKYAIDHLLHKASHDALTGLYNVSSFHEHLFELLNTHKQSVSSFGLIILDMDGLKTINDTYGHQAGDNAIIEFSQRLKNITRENDIVARLGGDEFALILPNLKEKQECADFMQRFIEKVNEPCHFEGHLLPMGVSVGCSVYPNDALDASELIKIADNAMYAMKKENKAKLKA
ncbi:MAG: GGDEF domain-containing protein [Campylobacterales bacterium]|nr:GGDEF domain-containing protein [Campylobacterales bacterium]